MNDPQKCRWSADFRKLCWFNVLSIQRSGTFGAANNTSYICIYIYIYIYNIIYVRQRKKQKQITIYECSTAARRTFNKISRQSRWLDQMNENERTFGDFSPMCMLYIIVSYPKMSFIYLFQNPEQINWVSQDVTYIYIYLYVLK